MTILVSVFRFGASAASVTLEWDPSPDANVAGYDIYYGTAPGAYTNVYAAGNVTNATVSSLAEGVTYFFAATAVAESGLESEFSNEISYTVPAAATNRPPTLAPLTDLAINEGASQQTVNLTGIGSGSATENQTLTVTAVSSNPSLIPHPAVAYTSPNATGTIRFTPVSLAFGSAVITVTVNDGGLSNNLVARSFTVTVNPVNQAPTLAPIPDIAINQGAPQQTVNLAGITSGASNELQTLTVTATTSNPRLVPTPTISYNSPATTGVLRFTPVASASGTATITVTVNDGATASNTASRSFKVTVNQPPTISTITNRLIAAGTSTPPIPFTVADVETPAASLQLTKASSNPALVPESGIVLGGSGANRTVTVTPTPGATGLAQITLSVSDGAALTSTSFKLTVEAKPGTPNNLRVVSN